MFALVLLSLVAVQEPDLDALLKQLEDESIEVREKAVARLAELGDAAEAKVKARLASAEGELKKRCEIILERIARTRKLLAVIPKLSKVTLDAKAKPAREVLEELVRQSELPVDPSQGGDASVSVSIKDALPLEALDAICRAADLEFLPESSHVWRPKKEGEKPSIQLRPGYSKAPRTFSGHFAVAVDEVSLTRTLRFQEERGTSSEGNVDLRFFWNPAVKASKISDFAVASARDDKGNDILFGEEDDFHHRFRHLRDLDHSDQDLNVALKRPGAGAERIAAVKGSVTILLALGRTTLAFENFPEAKGQVREVDGITFKFDEIAQEGEELRIKFSTSGKRKSISAAGFEESYGSDFSFDHDAIRIKTEDGSRPRGSSSSGSSSGKGRTNHTLSYQGLKSKVLSVEFTVDTEYHEMKVDFELKDIPLPK